MDPDPINIKMRIRAKPDPQQIAYITCLNLDLQQSGMRGRHEICCILQPKQFFFCQVFIKVPVPGGVDPNPDPTLEKQPGHGSDLIKFFRNKKLILTN